MGQPFIFFLISRYANADHVRNCGHFAFPEVSGLGHLRSRRLFISSISSLCFLIHPIAPIMSRSLSSKTHLSYLSAWL